MPTRFLSVLTLLFVIPALAAQPDIASLGPKVGERVPDFSATDQFGRTQNLQTILGAAGAMIVFYRSADW
jgi:hypothetical protein